jgi:hypothetical protein
VALFDDGKKELVHCLLFHSVFVMINESTMRIIKNETKGPKTSLEKLRINPDLSMSLVCEERYTVVINNNDD